MEEKVDDQIQKEKKIYEQLAFIHSILTQQTRYIVEEFEIAKDAALLITNMANELADRIKAAEGKTGVSEKVDE